MPAARRGAGAIAGTGTESPDWSAGRSGRRPRRAGRARVAAPAGRPPLGGTLRPRPPRADSRRGTFAGRTGGSPGGGRRGGRASRAQYGSSEIGLSGGTASPAGAVTGATRAPRNPREYASASSGRGRRTPAGGPPPAPPRPPRVTALPPAR